MRAAVHSEYIIEAFAVKIFASQYTFRIVFVSPALKMQAECIGNCLALQSLAAVWFFGCGCAIGRKWKSPSTGRIWNGELVDEESPSRQTSKDGGRRQKDAGNLFEKPGWCMFSQTENH